VHTILLDSLVYIARGGGGGSSGGGGGSGSGSGGGGGGIVFLAMIGFVPAHFLGEKFKKSDKVGLGSVMLWPLSVISLFILGYFISFYGVLVGIGALVGTGSGLYGWFNKLLKMNKKAKVNLATAAAGDPAWDEAAILAATQHVFLRFQTDWSADDAESMRPYTTPAYHYHAALMLYALKLAGRQNIADEPKIHSQYIVGVIDSTLDSEDRVTVAFTAGLRDILIDRASNKNLYQTRESFTEYWTFLRTKSGTPAMWLLEKIEQSTENPGSVSASLRQYAASLGYCFSPDWGWLLLPARGQLFGKGKFGVSDINNHIIGVYEGSLVQVYTYAPNVSSGGSTNDMGMAGISIGFNAGASSSSGEYYLVALAYLERSYGNILVRKRSNALATLFNAPKGLTRVETEWTNFNKKYQVFASSAEGAASFELLQPPYMEKLEALPFDCNIEVVDNVVYFYTKEKKMSAGNYPAMMSILHEAYTYMKR
jgi:hypothetical protein